MPPTTKYLLDERDMPSQWYNVVPDLPEPPPPPLHPATRQPIGPDDLAPLFPQALIAQEVTAHRYVDIPGEVLDVYRLWRPSPLYRARRLERASTPRRASTTSTRASARSARTSRTRRCRRRSTTRPGRKVLADSPDSTGSLGIAISEAVERATAEPDSRYALGSVLNHVLLHQTVIGEEALRQFALAEDVPDVIVGCTGGGSNFAGLVFPFLREKLAGRMSPAILAAEPAACPTLTRGAYAYDFGDTAGLTPLLKMYTLGHNFIPDPIHAGGLRYHGMSPLLSHIHHLGLFDSFAIPQRECFAAGVRFARTEGIIPAPEPTHALAGTVREALRCKETGEEKAILTALCGHAHLDLPAYGSYLSGEIVDHELPDAELAATLAELPG